MSFEKLGCKEAILQAIAKQGYKQATPIQEAVIPLVLKHQDVIASAQTGTGKTAAFALPIIQLIAEGENPAKRRKRIKALVVSPTRELALQIEANFKKYSSYTKLRTTVVYGGTAIDAQQEALDRGVDILIATPGRLLDLFKQERLSLRHVETLVLDEADMMLDMGFIADIKKIVRICPEEKQTLLFSATMPQNILHLSKSILRNPKKVAVNTSSSPAKKIDQSVYHTPKTKKVELFLHLLRNETIKGHTIVFRRTKFGVDKLEKTLVKNGFKATSLHGDKSQVARQEALDQFKRKEATILIATDVASRGIDIDELDAVVNFDLPHIPETYVHRIGRTARANKKGQAFSLCSPDESSYIESIQKLIRKTIPVIKGHPYPLSTKEKAKIVTKPVSKHKKGRKSAASKKKKKHWY